MITTEQLDLFIALLNEKRAAYNAASGFAWATTFTAEVGKKYARIVKSDMGDSRSAFCFVDLATGAILKAAGWSSPAKHARGNISNGAADLGPYGAYYLK